MSRLLGVSRSGFYAWQGRRPSHRQREDERLKVAIKVVHQRSRESYGVRRLQPELAAKGFPAGRDRIARLRQDLGLRCRQKRKFRATTNSKHSLPVAENMLNQTFAPKAPDEMWLTDITYIATDEGWLYLAGVKDVFTCEIVWLCHGGAHDPGLDGPGALSGGATEAAGPRIDPSLGSGSQYCALAYRQILDQFGMQASMSRKGNCYDNASMESFRGSLKNELVHHQRYATRAQAEASIRECIEIFYNRQRRHSRLGYLAPAVFAQNFRRQPAAAA